MKITAVECNVDQELVSKSIEVLSINDFIHLKKIETNLLIWNNLYFFYKDYLSKLPFLRHFLNWGTDLTNIDEDILSCKHIDFWDTGGYCTKAVVEWTMQKIATNTSWHSIEKPIGFIGLGRIGYSLAKRLEEPRRLMLYNAKNSHPGVSTFMRIESTKQILQECGLIIIAIQGTKSIPEQSAIRANRNHPFIINLSRESVFPLENISDLLLSGRISAISDNKKPSTYSTFDECYTGHTAYKSKESKKNKHNILQTVINRTSKKYSIYFARHGQTIWNVEQRIQGQFLSSPLTDEGKNQAKRLGVSLKSSNIARIYTSVSERAVKTAEIVAEEIGASIEYCPALREMNFGVLAGLPRSAFRLYPSFIANRQQDKLMTSYPKGESYFEVAIRLQAILDSITARGKNTLIIGHESVNRMARGIIVRGDLRTFAHLQQQNHELIEYKFSAGKYAERKFDF